MSIRSSYISMGVAALAVAAAGIASAASSPATQASIPFANHGGIRDWAADRNQGLWVQDARRNWYYAKFLGPCFGLNFATALGFDTRPAGSFDRFSSVIVPREGRCMVQSFVPSEGPPSRKKANESGLPQSQ